MMGMKSRVIILGALVSLMAGCGSTKQHAQSASSEDMMLETLVRPLSLISTIGGSAIYVVTSPFSIASGNNQEARRLLVDKPFKATFSRAMGDFQRLKEIKEGE